MEDLKGSEWFLLLLKLFPDCREGMEGQKESISIDIDKKCTLFIADNIEFEQILVFTIL